LIQDESNETPTPEEEEGAEPTAAPDETPGVPEGEPAEDPGAAPDETLSESIGDAPEAEADAAPEAEPEPETEPETEPEPAAEPEPVAESESESEAEPAAEPAAEPEVPSADSPAEISAEADDVTETEQTERRPPKPSKAEGDEPEVIPGAHLEPDLVLDQTPAEGDEDYSRYAVEDEGDETEGPTEPEAPAVRSPLELAADARYHATGKRKTAIARVILKPGSGNYVINGKTLDEYFPRDRLRTQARQPLDATGNLSRMDVVARIHGGGVSAQAGALRHGIARALVEAEPSLRTELKRRGYLTRDPREKERKKAGLKKARKRPQFSKR
jgi:small subunit ribosomal protein S9